jgi:hypothetical protein
MPLLTLCSPRGWAPSRRSHFLGGAYFDFTEIFRDGLGAWFFKTAKGWHSTSRYRQAARYQPRNSLPAVEGAPDYLSATQACSITAEKLCLFFLAMAVIFLIAPADKRTCFLTLPRDLRPAPARFPPHTTAREKSKKSLTSLSASNRSSKFPEVVILRVLIVFDFIFSTPSCADDSDFIVS